MKYIFELTKEHKTLPKEEILAILKSEKINYELIETNEDILIVKSIINKKKIRDIFTRLSYTHYFNEYYFSCETDLNKIKKESKKNKIKITGSMAIKYKNRSENIKSKPIVKTLAETYSKNQKVSLDEPDFEIRVLINDSKIYVGKKILEFKRKDFEKRKVQNRPFFSPISLHPKLARALVNISEVKKDDTVLDPFCGTGGILIEAGLMGLKVIGSDIEDKMIKGTKKNLEFYNIKKFNLICSDIGNLNKSISKVDSVVTDLPYGKSTTTKGEEKIKLYTRAFENISKILKKQGKAVIGLSNKDLINQSKNYLNLVKIFEVRTHRSLTRYFAVFEKP